MIYLDNAATTKTSKEVIDSMLPFFDTHYGNPSSLHSLGRFANKSIKKARKQIATLINADPCEIYITSGGTESNNSVISGIQYNRQQNHIITSIIEHESILNPCARLEKHGFKITYVNVDNNGIIDPIDIEKSITNKTCLVSIMSANNEIGTIQPIYKISKICNKYRIPFHTDAVQSAGKICIDVKKLHIDMLTLSSHKINGPKGIGALYIKQGLKISPFLLGGGQENGFRSGTENVANIVGFGKACELSYSNMLNNFIYTKKLQQFLIASIKKEIPNSILNGHDTLRLSTNVNFSFLGINGEDLLLKLDENGIAASTSSACTLQKKKSSHVLKAMGLSYDIINSSLRLTLSNLNNYDEIKYVITTLKNIVNELRIYSNTS